MASPREPVPDLLQRFVATPFKLIARGCTIETNEVDLLELFDDPDLHLPTGYKFRIVRDRESVRMAGQPRIICGVNSCLLLAGGTVVMIDRVERRAFAFISPEITAEIFAQKYLPIALRHVPEHESAG